MIKLIRSGLRAFPSTGSIVALGALPKPVSAAVKSFILQDAAIAGSFPLCNAATPRPFLLRNTAAVRPLTPHTSFLGVYLDCRKRFAGLSAANLIRTRALSTTAGDSESCNKFTWTDFFETRRSMRRWELATGIVTAIVAFLGSCFYLFTIASFDPTDMFFGVIDSYTLYIILPGFVAVLSYVAGLAMGSSIWRMSRDKSILPSIDRFNKNFYDRITNNRAPEAAIVSPIPKLSSPDYYGEKILSPADYRKWLKKQRMLAKRRQESEKVLK